MRTQESNRLLVARATAFAGVALVFVPLLPGLFWALALGLSLEVWRALLVNSEWPLAIVATLISSVLSPLVALLLWAPSSVNTPDLGR